MNPSEPTRQGDALNAEHGEILEQAFARHQDEVLGMLYYLVGNAEDARDAFQEAFIRCWRCRQNLAEILNLRAWIFRIALNVGRDLRATAWRRRRRSLPDDEGLMPASSDGRPDAEYAQREQMDRLRQAVRQLRAEEQEVFLLRQNGDMTYDEIGAALGIPVGTVKTRMRLAVEKLRGTLNPAPPAQTPGS
jgi:RNA polymerase sigma-70 factor (ECF subfamily)